MPISPTYPGVYVEEIPSGVRTISGVSTSITAFLGRASRGPVNDPWRVTSLGAYEGVFGGIARDSSMSYAVSHYFLNGGGDALIVRLVDDDGAAASLSLAVDGSSTPIVLSAVPEGTRGNRLRATVGAPAATDYPLTLTLVSPEGITVATEALTIDSTMSLASQLVATSALARADGAHTGAIPAPVTSRPFTGGVDAATASTVSLPVTTGTLTFTQPTGTGTKIYRVTLERFPSDPTNANTFNVLIERFAASDTSLSTVEASWSVDDVTLATVVAALTAAASPVTAAVSTTSGRPQMGADTFLDNASLVVTTFSASLDLEAASPGVWGDGLTVEVDHDTSGEEAGAFNLTVTELDADGEVVRQENLRNLSLDETSARYITLALEEESNLVRVDGALPTTRPQATTTGLALAGGADGGPLEDADYQGSEGQKTGMYALLKADLFNLLCIPPPTLDTDTSSAVWSEAATFCAQRRALLLVDPPAAWDEATDVTEARVDALAERSASAALYFPRYYAADPLRRNLPQRFVPCGAVAGVIARTDGTRGIWKAPAGLESTVVGARKLDAALTDPQIGALNQIAVNCLKQISGVGAVVWGARTLIGSDRLGSEWRYVPVRRTALHIEESLYRGLQWAVFEPNDEPLWAQIRLNVGTFMHGLFRQGAFQGRTPKEAYFVRCDGSTTLQADIDLGRVNILVGFAPLKPAEFVIVKLQQMAGQLST